MNIEEHAYTHGSITTTVRRGDDGDVVITVTSTRSEWKQQVLFRREEWEQIVRDFPVAAFQSPLTQPPLPPPPPPDAREQLRQQLYRDQRELGEIEAILRDVRIKLNIMLRKSHNSPFLTKG